MKYIYFQRIRLLKNKIAAELRNKTKNEGCPATFVFLYLYMFFRYFLGV